MRTYFIGFVALTFVLAALVGCQRVSRVLPNSTWHKKFNWEAEDYFDDLQVIALCQAIEKNDLAEIDRLVAAGADVNAQGKGNMTPLLWAYPNNKLPRLKRLLEHGADPNVIVESDFGTRGAIMSGDSVTYMASGTFFPGYFEAIFSHGGDPNIERETRASGKGETPIFMVIMTASNKEEKIRLLLNKGADINHRSASGSTPTIKTVSWGGQFRLTLMLLEAGADHMVYKPRSNTRLVHILLGIELSSSNWTPTKRADYQAVVKWLEDHGESFEQARQDRLRWRSYGPSRKRYRRKMDAEVAARKAREAQQNNPAINNKDADK